MEHYYIRSQNHTTTERILKNGKKVWDVSFRIYTIDGDCKKKWIRGFASKRMAEQGYLDFITQHCEIIHFNFKRKKDPVKEKLIVGELFKQYMATLGNVNKQSVVYDKHNIFRLYILSKYENTPVDALTKEELYQWQDWLWAQKNPRTNGYFSHKYLTKIRGYLNHFLQWIEQRYGFTNNLTEVQKPKNRTQRKEMQIWTREMFDTKFLPVVDNPTYRALFTFMFYTGRRKGELFALYKTDVKADKITFNKSVNRRTFGADAWEITETKSYKSCTIPVCKPVQEEIKQYTPPKEGKFYFGGEEPLAPTSVERYFKKYTELAGLPFIRIHDLRHSFVSLMLSREVGANLLVVSDLISDTVEQVTKTYAHLIADDVNTALSKI